MTRSLSERLNAAGVPFRIVPKQAGTGTVYLCVCIPGTHGLGSYYIRVSDHRERQEVQTTPWVNFSRPRRRYYGVWCFTKQYRISRKVERIIGGIVRRVDAYQTALQPAPVPFTRWAGQTSIDRPAAPLTLVRVNQEGGEI